MQPGSEPLVIVLPGGRRFPVRDGMTIGRADEATIKIDDRTVSRMHARIVETDGGLTIADAGSRYGVFVSGQQLLEPRVLVAGQEVRLGNVVLRVERARAPKAMGGTGSGVAGAVGPVGVTGAGRAAGPVGVSGSVRTAGAGVPAGSAPGGSPAPAPPGPSPNATIVVPVGATDMGLRAAAPVRRDGAIRPRLRSGWALKRVEDDPGDERYVLRDLRSGDFLQIDRYDAQLLALLDGSRTITELLAAAGELLGEHGSARLARLIADFGDRGLLDGVAPTPRLQAPPGLLARAFKVRERTFDWLPEYFKTAYRHWGRLYFSPLAATFLVLLSLAGLVVFSYLVGARYGTPFVVAQRLLIGGAVFMAGRFLIVIVHELAHGLALAHYGRSTSRAGLRLLFIFPYAFVDSSESYFEPRNHRIVISAAGPLSDFSLAALFSIACAVSPPGNVRSVFFQLAFAGYVGGFFNVNPFLDRDGYQILCDWLREPALKQRARAQLRARISGQSTGEQGSPVLARYAIAGLVWSLIGAGFVAVLSLRYYDRLAALAPHGLVVAGFILFFAILLLPIPIALGAPLVSRARYGSPEVNRVIT